MSDQENWNERLPEELATPAAPALAEMLKGRRGGPLVLDASAVKRLGGCCAQILLSAKESWASDGAELVIENPSREFQMDAAILGVADMLAFSMEGDQA